MPTECERSTTLPAEKTSAEETAQDSAAAATIIQHCGQQDLGSMERDMNGEMSTSTGSTSSSSTTNGHNGTSNGGRKSSITSPDPTAYVAKARVTRPTPPPPSYNPMQFVQIKPCNLYQTAQQQLKKAEEVKKIKEIKKEEPEDWQNNLDNWKSSRRKRVEHIIDRVVEVKKLELEEHDRSRRKSKTFSEMIEERGERGVRVGRAKLASLAVYNEDESNDLSDLGIGTSSASGKSSLSEDYDNNSVMSDNADLDKAIFDNHQAGSCTTREYISSPGYDTSSSTAPASSPDPCEYTYEGAIQDYKQRVSRATSGSSTGFKLNQNVISNSQTKTSSTTSKESTPERINNGAAPAETYPTRRGSKIEERLIGFEVNSPNDSQDLLDRSKVDVPKIDISKRKEIFEGAASNNNKNAAIMELKPQASNGVPKVMLRDRFNLDVATIATDSQATAKNDAKRYSGDISSIKDRLQSLEQQQNLVGSTDGSNRTFATKVVDIPVPPLKVRLSSLQNAATKEDFRKSPVVLVDARQLEIMKDEEENAKMRMKQIKMTTVSDPELAVNPIENKEAEVDRDDSGIHTSDDIEDDRSMEQLLLQQTQDQQLNDAIAALALEEQQLEQAANAVNQIEAEFAELSSTSMPTTVVVATEAPATNEQPCEMEFSINEALELALEAIDKETTKTTRTTTLTTTITNDDNNCTSKPNTATHSTDEPKNQSDINIGDEGKTEPDPETDTLTEIDRVLESERQRKKIVAVRHDGVQETAAEEEEQTIQNEPIYENVSTTSTATVDSKANIIPCNSKILNQNNNRKNQATKIQNQNIVHETNALSSRTNTVPSTSSPEQQPTVADSPLSMLTKTTAANEDEPYYQVPKSSEPYYDAPKHLRPVPVYENMEIFYSGLENSTLSASNGAAAFKMEPPKEKPPPPPTESPTAFDDIDSVDNGDNWSSDNTYETISNRQSHGPASGKEILTAVDPHPSPPIKRINSTKRIKKELRHKRSSFLGIEGSADDDLDSYLHMTVAPPPDIAQLLQEERRLEKQLYMKAGLCDSSDTGDSRDSGVSENHSRQSSEPYTNSSEEAERAEEHSLSLNMNSNLTPNAIIFHNEAQLLVAAQTPLLQTVKGNSAESWTESATAAAAATKSLTEATATANAKMLSIEEKIREQEEVLRVERELLHLEQEELKRQRENLMLRENLARRELQHGAKMLMSANRRSLQDLNGGVAGFQPAMTAVPVVTPQQAQPQPQQQQIYANVPNMQHQYYQVDTDYRKSMSDLNEFSKRLMLAPPLPPTKPMRAMHVATTNGHDDFERQRHVLNAQTFGGSLVKIASPTAVTTASQRPCSGALFSNFHHQQSSQNLAGNSTNSLVTNGPMQPQTNMTRNTLHALSATPKPKYTDGWVQVQNRKSFDSNLSNDPAWLSAYQQKRKSVPDTYQSMNTNNCSNHWLVQEAEQRRLAGQQQRRSLSTTNTPVHQRSGVSAQPTTVSSTGKPLPDSIIQTLTERVQSKGIGERKRFENYNNNSSSMDKSPLHAAASYQQSHGHQPSQHQQHILLTHPTTSNGTSHRHPLDLGAHHPMAAPSVQDKVLSVSGKKKCSHCGDELGRGAAMIIESLLLFYHINCFKCCVCHVQLGDGLNGTDVRVRNHKLHCQNCYSSDDGIKFSCV